MPSLEEVADRIDGGEYLADCLGLSTNDWLGLLNSEDLAGLQVTEQEAELIERAFPEEEVLRSQTARSGIEMAIRTIPLYEIAIARHALAQVTDIWGHLSCDAKEVRRRARRQGVMSIFPTPTEMRLLQRAGQVLQHFDTITSPVRADSRSSR